MKELIIKPEDSTPLAVFYRIVYQSDKGEYVFYRNMKAYIVRKDGKAYIDYYESK